MTVLVANFTKPPKEVGAQVAEGHRSVSDDDYLMLL
jgi:hypothetical protein